MSERDYTIVVTARRWRWLPWPTDVLTFSKRTTWAEAYALALRAYETRAHRVSLYDEDSSFAASVPAAETGDQP